MRQRIIVAIALALAFSAPSGALVISHQFSPVYSMVYFQTANRNSYQFHSPGLNYYLKTGEKTGFFTSATVFFPAVGSQSAYDFPTGQPENPSWVDLWSIYNISTGFDLVMGLGATFPSGFTLNLKHRDHMLFDAGLGLHLNGIFLHHTDFDNRYFDSLTLGIGLDVRASIQLENNFYIGWMINTNFDFLDLLHSENKMISYFGLNTGVTFGFRSGGAK